MAERQDTDLLRTPLYDQHVAAKARLVDFAGYALPVQYEGIIAEHKWTRQSAGLFDVSHMGPAFVALGSPTGDADQDHHAISTLVEPLVCGDIAGLKPGQVRYTLLLDETGGILDDLMIARPPAGDASGMLYIVVNAATKDADFERIGKALGAAAKLERADDQALIALQGPSAAEVIADLMPQAAQLSFMNHALVSFDGEVIRIARSGYTGEDGFEMLVPASAAGALWDQLAADERVKPVGLGARDSLRLEAGLPLYGHDLDATTSPIEAGLGFAVSKRRREAADFPGAERILRERTEGPERVRIGLHIEGAPAREGAEILDPEGNKIGVVTSGGFSPSLGRAIALGFVPEHMSDPGTALQVLLRGRVQPATVVETPFVPHRYVRNSKTKPQGPAA
ncbi:glycine cleavage system aminomethyltransferase GcvT [Devosia pacifica]|nr:glycine cleavage system aminomethyltransferase GcvT [Devosia pacifica]